MQTISLSISGSADEPVVGRRRPGDGDVGRVGEHTLEHVVAVADVERQLDVRVLGRRTRACSAGTNDSAAVVTAAIRRLRAATAVASSAAWRPWSSRPITSAA